MSLKPLSSFQAQPYRPRTTVVAGLAVVAALYTGSMFLNWVGVITAGGSYVIVKGIQQANWILVVAAILVGLTVRVSRVPPDGIMRFLFVALDFFVPLGLYIEYIDNLGRAESYTTTPYLGPGFFLAVGATVMLVAATVLGWREREQWSETAGTERQS
jgi:hypothetical protein